MRRAAGSFGSRNGMSWSRDWADYRSRIEAAQLSDTGAGQAAQLLPTSVEAMRRAVEAQVCPWCAAGPYKLLSGHTNSAHGVSASELRELLGYTTKMRICSEDVSAGARERLVARPDFAETTARANRRAVEVASHEKARDAFVKRTFEANAEKHREALRLYASNESITFEDIGEQVGLHPRTVRESLKRAGVAVDEHRSRINKPKAREFVDAVAEGRRKAAERRRAELARRFAELGSDWPAVVALATEMGTTSRNTRARLLDAGIAVPPAPRLGRPGPRPTKPKAPCAEADCGRDAICRGMCRMHYQRWRLAKS